MKIKRSCATFFPKTLILRHFLQFSSKKNVGAVCASVHHFNCNFHEFLHALFSLVPFGEADQILSWSKSLKTFINTNRGILNPWLLLRCTIVYSLIVWLTSCTILKFSYIFCPQFVTMQLQFDWQVAPAIVAFHAFFVCNLFATYGSLIDSSTILTFHTYTLCTTCLQRGCRLFERLRYCTFHIYIHTQLSYANAAEEYFFRTDGFLFTFQSLNSNF